MYATVPGSFSGTYQRLLGSSSLLVLDTVPDNYGTYAADGLPDSWQNQCFGLDNPNAAPNKGVTGTGQNNLFKYIAGLAPTNSTSVFRLRIEPVAGQPNQKKLVFSPRWKDRAYTVQYRTNLVGGATWTNAVNTSTSDAGSERSVIDLDATGPARFYRIQITFP